MWVKWVLAGILSMTFGLLVLSNTTVASITVSFMAGMLFAVSGGMCIVGGITDQGIFNKICNVILGMLMLALGISFIANPLEGSITLALVVAILIGSSGALRMVVAWQMRETPLFWAMLISAAISILLAGLIFADFETISRSLLGLILGIELLIHGFGAFVLGLFLRRAA
ncbi:MAG: DUF308 domain-containing protein [Pseudomonadota bacterium]